MKRKWIYLAGPMTGKPYSNYEAFAAAARVLRTQGHIVKDPAQRDMSVYGVDIFFDNPYGDLLTAAAMGFDLREAAASDLAFIAGHADAIALLPGWEDSKGARAEKAVADWLGLEVIYL